MSQAWHGSKFLHDLPKDIATPMIKRNDGKIFYVKELVRCNDNKWFRPRRFVLDKEDRMYAIGDVIIQQHGCFQTLVDETGTKSCDRIHVSSFELSHLEVELLVGSVMFFNRLSTK